MGEHAILEPVQLSLASYQDIPGLLITGLWVGLLAVLFQRLVLVFVRVPLKSRSLRLLLAGIILFALTTLFSFITLPVEINASKRALVWLSNSGITNSYNHAQAEDALRSAAYTYVVAALGSLATLIYYIMIFLGRRD